MVAAAVPVSNAKHVRFGGRGGRGREGERVRHWGGKEAGSQSGREPGRTRTGGQAGGWAARMRLPVAHARVHCLCACVQVWTTWHRAGVTFAFGSWLWHNEICSHTHGRVSASWPRVGGTLASGLQQWRKSFRCASLESLSAS